VRDEFRGLSRGRPFRGAVPNHSTKPRGFKQTVPGCLSPAIAESRANPRPKPLLPCTTHAPTPNGAPPTPAPRAQRTYSFCVSEGRLAAACDATQRTAAHTAASAAPTTRALHSSQATPTPPDGQSVDRHSHIFPQKNKRQTKRSPATTQKCQQCDRLLQQSVAAPRRGGNYHTLVLKP